MTTLPQSRFYTAPWKRNAVEVTAIYAAGKPDMPIVYCLKSCDAALVVAELNREARYREPHPS